MNILFLCIKIFCVRIIDVSMGTFRTIVTIKGKKLYAATIGFFEVLIWFLVVKEALNTTETSIWIAIAYASGFASGTFIGSILSNKFIKGNLSVQVITTKKNLLVDLLREQGYAVSIIEIKGKDELQKYMLFIEINNNSLYHVQNMIKSIDKNAFIVINETKYVENGLIK